MSASGYCIFTDAVSYRAKLRGMLDVLVVPLGAFHARLTWVELPNLRLLRLQEGSPRLAYVALPRGKVFVTFPTSRGSRLICNGVELCFGDIMLHGRGERFHQRTRAANCWGTISLSPAALTAFSKTITGQELVPPRIGRILRPFRSDRRMLLRLHAQVGRIAEKTLHHIVHPEVARALEQDLICALVNCLTKGEAADGSDLRRSDAGLMARLEAVLRSNRGRTLKVSDICRAIGVADRTLRICCSHILGMGPGRYVRLRRANQVG